MAKLTLSVADRLSLLMNLPEKGSVTEMLAKRALQHKLDFSGEELDKFKIKSKDGVVTWDNSVKTNELEFAKSELDYMKTVVDKMSENKQITDAFLDTAQKILELTKEE